MTLSIYSTESLKQIFSIIISFIILFFLIQNRAQKILTVIQQTAFIAYQMENVANLIMNIVTLQFAEKEMGIVILQTNAL